MATQVSSRWIAWLAAWLLAALVACGADERPGAPSGVSAGTGARSPGTASPASSGPPGAEADNPEPAIQRAPPPPASDECNEVELSFAPQVPSVFVLVDRSSSMFERSLWAPLKDGVLAVVAQLESDVRFGFSSYTGAQGMQCPELTAVVPLAERNSAAIKSAYDAITRPQYKAETPTSLALQAVTAILLEEPANSPKYIVLVTDGEPDFCDDPNVTCSRDAVVAAVQAAHAQGIGTFIYSVGGEVARSHLEDVANAGVGQPVMDRDMAVRYQCPASTARYSASSGSAPFFEPDVNDRAALVAALTSTIAGVRGCAFDLQGSIQIDLALADQGVVEIDGVRIPFGGDDGYRMNSETQLELLGAACARLKRPETKRVLIDFPCEAIELL